MDTTPTGPATNSREQPIGTDENGSALSRIMMAFESLGGAGHGCEFGLLQRASGAEPLGLLRWADLGYDMLVAALEREFEGVGEPENTIVFFPNGNQSHYWSRDSRFWMAQGFHVPAAKISMEAATVQICRRQQFLRRKLLADLREGDKIFVFKNSLRNLNDDEIARLHAAICRYGNSTLLYVRIEDADHANGTVECVEKNLMIGYIDHFSHSLTDEHLGISFESWATICHSAHALWARSRSPDESSESTSATC
jgi:hypothetical protein